MSGPGIKRHGPPLGREAERGEARQRRDRVGPGAGGVDHDRRGEVAGAGGDGPRAGLAPQRGDAGVGDELAAAAAQAAR